MITEETLREYVECLVRNLKNINNPDEFYPEMRFRSVPKMIININEGQTGIEIKFTYNYTEHVGIVLATRTNKFSEMTNEDIEKSFGDSAVINYITHKVYRLFNNCKC